MGWNYNNNIVENLIVQILGTKGFAILRFVRIALLTNKIREVFLRIWRHLLQFSTRKINGGAKKQWVSRIWSISLAGSWKLDCFLFTECKSQIFPYARRVRRCGCLRWGNSKGLLWTLVCFSSFPVESGCLYEGNMA